jgi:hypothetical protein
VTGHPIQCVLHGDRGHCRALQGTAAVPSAAEAPCRCSCLSHSLSRLSRPVWLDRLLPGGCYQGAVPGGLLLGGNPLLAHASMNP